MASGSAASQQRPDSVYLGYLPQPGAQSRQAEGTQQHGIHQYQPAARSGPQHSSSPASQPRPPAGLSKVAANLQSSRRAGPGPISPNPASTQSLQQQQQQQSYAPQQQQPLRDIGVSGGRSVATAAAHNGYPLPPTANGHVSSNAVNQARTSPPRNGQPLPGSSVRAFPPALQQQQYAQQSHQHGGRAVPSQSARQNQPGLRPLQLRQQPQGPPPQPQPQSQYKHRGQQIPTLKVTVPQPASSAAVSTQAGMPFNDLQRPPQAILSQSHPPRSQFAAYQPQASSPLSQSANGQPRSSPRLPYGGPQAQNPFANPGMPSSPDTLVGSANSHKDYWLSGSGKKMSPPSSLDDHGNWSPSSSTAHSNNSFNPPPSPSVASIRNLQLSTKAAVAGEALSADPENDRLMPAVFLSAGGSPRSPSPGGANLRTDFWKRFSAVVHENEAKEAMAEKVGHKKGGNARKSRSSWLERASAKQRSYRIWVGVIAFLILAAIAGGVAYHFVTKKQVDGSTPAANPATHDLNLESTTTSGVIATTVTADDVTTVMPAASSVPAGASLRVRSALPPALATAAPILVDDAQLPQMTLSSRHGIRRRVSKHL